MELLGGTPSDKARIQAAVTHGVPFAKPGQNSLDTEAITTVRARAILAHILVPMDVSELGADGLPVVGRGVDSFALEAGHQLILEQLA